MTSLEGIQKQKAIENVVRRAVNDGWHQSQAVKDAAAWLQRNEANRRGDVVAYVAEQYALKAQRDLERIKIEAEQKIAQATAEAEALRLQKANVTPELIRLRQIEASMKAIEKWDGHMPKVTGGALPFIDMKSLEGK